MLYKHIHRLPKGDRARAVSPLGTALLLAVSVLAGVLPAQTGLATSAEPRPSAAGESYVFVSAWDNAPLRGTFKEPHGIAVDAGGNVYVADTGNYRIEKFTADGTVIAAWGTEGSSWHGRFIAPAAIAADSAGNVYVGDLWGGAYDFQKFDSAGAFVASWYLLYGYDPVGVAVDGSNNVYIATHVGYGLILKYDAAGQLLTSWQCSSQSSAESDGIAVDPHGYVYVADVRNSVIYKFDLDGHPLTSWPHTFPQWHNTLYASDTQLAVDGAGNVYALADHSVKKYSATGTLLGEWGQWDQFESPHGIAIGPDGSVFVADTGNNRVQKLTPTGSIVRQWGVASDRSALRHPEGVTVSGDGTVYVADAYADQVMAFTSRGLFLTRWSTMDYPSDMGTDSSGNVYLVGPGVPDLGSRTIHTDPYGIRSYTPAGVLLNQWGKCCGSADAQTNWASGLAVAPDGTLFVADTNNDRILKLSRAGTLIAKWGDHGWGNGEFFSPQGVALAPDGSVYVADTLNNRIQRFTSNGGFLAQWGTNGAGDGQFDHPKGIALDSSGYVYVADAFNDRVQKFSPDGVFVTKWGSFGAGNGQFDTPLGVALDASGYVYVADSRNNRIQKFQRASPDLSPSSKNVDRSAAQSGDTLNYTIVVRNTGRLDAPAVATTDAIPSATRFNPGSLAATAGSCSESGGLITWTGKVQAGASVTITFAVTINSGAPRGTLISNSAVISDGSNPALSRTALTIANPYQIRLPMLAK